MTESEEAVVARLKALQDDVKILRDRVDRTDHAGSMSRRRAIRLAVEHLERARLELGMAVRDE